MGFIGPPPFQGRPLTLRPTMCGSAPNAPKEVSSAKCIGGTVLGFGIVTLIGFALGAPGALSAVGGLFATIAGSMLCCCGPKEPGKGACLHVAAMVMSILGAICHAAGSAWLIIWYITTLAAIEADRVSCRDTCSESGFGCGDACDASAGLLSAVVTAGLIFMIPTLAFAIVSFILEIILAVKCNAAKRAIESGKGPQA